MGSVGEVKLQNRMSSFSRPLKFEIDLEEIDLEEGRFMDMEADGGEGWQFNTKRPRPDPSETVSQPSSTVTSQGLPWNTGNSILVDVESEWKKQKRSYGGEFVCNSSRSSITDLAPGVPPVDDRRCVQACGEASTAPDELFFPYDSHSRRPSMMNFDFLLTCDSVSGKASSPAYEDRLNDPVPNLELALGAEKKPSKPGILPWYLGSSDKKTEHDKPPDMVTIKEEDNDDAAAASLSLSLSFPIPEKERTVKPVPRTEQLLPERPNVNTSLLLFGRGLPDS